MMSVIRWFVAGLTGVVFAGAVSAVVQAPTAGMALLFALVGWSVSVGGVILFTVVLDDH